MMRRRRPLAPEREGLAPLMVCKSIIRILPLIAMVFRSSWVRRGDRAIGARSLRVVAQTEIVLRQAQHERKKCILSNPIPFTLSLSKGEQGFGQQPVYL
jgi:hypothetical protein